MKYNVLLDIGMKAQGHWAGFGCLPQDLLYFFRIVIGRECEFHLYFRDPSRIGSHDLGNLGGGAIDIEVMGLGCDTHDGQHAIPERSGHKIRRGKSFSLAHVIHGCVGDDLLL